MTMDVTFLTEQQIWGDEQGKGQLQVMKDYGTKTGMSDLAIVQGGLMGTTGAKTSDDQPAGYVWSASSYKDGNVRIVYYYGDRYTYVPSRRSVGARPALPSSVVSSIKPSEVRPTREISGVQIVEFGEYPQTIAPENIGNELEQEFLRGQLQTTDKTYTFDGEANNAFDKPFKPEEYAEYQHNGKRYIRVEAKPYDDDSKLSNGRKPATGEPCWIEVQPIEWLKDPSGVMVARQALFSGVQFDRNNGYDGNFAGTDMKKYLQNHFAKEMVAGRNVDAPEAQGPVTAAVLERREIQRQRALEDPTQGL
jgi:hypothetical protein